MRDLGSLLMEHYSAYRNVEVLPTKVWNSISLENSNVQSGPSFPCYDVLYVYFPAFLQMLIANDRSVWYKQSSSLSFESVLCLFCVPDSVDMLPSQHYYVNPGSLSGVTVSISRLSWICHGVSTALGTRRLLCYFVI